ncbi:MAG: Two-domain glycosyltransferase [Acidobacteria bacterium]|nr:Two-domain glycosyltransferase [Acidobacteriota bacterium]
MDPLVSIVIPVYNGSNYLRQSIDSALAQTYPNVEVLVVNDGSRDGGQTEAVALSYGHRIRYLSQPNGGVSSALNHGIREMSGEWFCWLSHDDRYLPAKVAAQVDYWRRQTAAQVICCNFEAIDEQGSVTETIEEPARLLRTGRDVLSTWIFGCALMIRRELFTRTGPFNETNRTTQDLEMWLSIVQQTPIHYLPDVLCQWRQHAEAGSRTESRYQRDKDELFGRMLQRYDAAFFDPQLAGSRRERARLYFWLSHNALQRFAFGGARLALKRAWREWPSPRNPALFRLLFGFPVWFGLQWVRAQTISKARWLGRLTKRG